jgi:sec-independent protein translocase protein TatB
MFGLGFGEILIILVLALILLGPKKLPDVAKQLGKGMREFRKATDDLKGQFEREVYADEVRRTQPQVVAPPTGAAPVQAPPPGPAPAATAENVPGLDVALVEPPAPGAAPAGPAASSPADPGKPA